MATSENILKCKDIVLSDKERTFVVVSAPGKRFKGDEKVTDILIERFGKLSDELGLGLRDYCVSRGEEIMARLFAKLLDFEYIDAKDFIDIDNAKVIGAFPPKPPLRGSQPKGFVMGGFYGRGKNGEVKTFERGGSDTSGAVVANCLGADLYEIFTDTYGVFDENGKTIPHMTFEQFYDMGLRKVLNGVPIKIDNTFDPDKSYTLIC